MIKRITYDVSPRGSEWTVTKRGASRPWISSAAR
jgi:hypothetical protein